MSQAMRGFVDWAVGRPYRLIVLMIAFAQILAPIAGALVVLDVLRRGPTAATLDGIVALAGIALIGLLVGAEVGTALGLAAPVILGCLACGVLLGATRSLTLAFQGTVLGAIGLTVAGLLLVPGADRLGDLLLAETLNLLESLGVTAEQLADFGEIPPAWLVQLLFTTLLVSVLAGLMLGYWWHTLGADHGRFGRDFRALRLGRVAGAMLTVLVALQLVSTATPVQTAAQLAVMGFLFQGLAVMHARSRSDQWHGVIIVLVYVALFSFSPLSLLAIAGLSVVGLLDNFFALRARGKPEF